MPANMEVIGDVRNSSSGMVEKQLSEVKQFFHNPLLFSAETQIIKMIREQKATLLTYSMSITQEASWKTQQRSRALANTASSSKNKK